MRTCLLRSRAHAYCALRAPWLVRRPFASSARAAEQLQTSFPHGADSGRKHDDATLRRVFDSHDFWQDFNRGHSAISHSHAGLFQNRFLVKPTGFVQFAQEIRQKCQGIVETVLGARTIEDLRAIPQQMDLLSDCICRVLDLADFVRATHPDRQFQRYATQAYVYLWEYMNILNTTPGLKTQLQKAINTPECSSSWNEEEARVAKSLLTDFSNSAIDLPEKYRQRFVELSNDSKQLGTDFLENMAPEHAYVKLGREEAAGLSPTFSRDFRARSGGISLPLDGNTPYTALAFLNSEEGRERVYRAMKTSKKSQLENLKQFLKTRCDIASLSNYDSYASMTLSDKMAKTPEAVMSFLKALSKDNIPLVRKEISYLAKIKQFDGLGHAINPWDAFYYQQRLDSTLQPTQSPGDELSTFFSIGTVMQGLSRVFDRLYGIRFVARPITPGETWTPEVRRLDVVHETDGHVAVLYCDLFQRSGKSPNPAHFTLRCSRRISDSEIADESLVNHDGMARAVSPVNGTLHQLPTITLICDFLHQSHHHTPSLLSFRDVQTLFHEMGHAIHSILGRTSLQVVSGTRCATDFAELPSVLMERFAADESVLSIFARHWKDDTPLPYDMVRHVLERQKRGQGLHTETQILYSLLDQAYHSSLAKQDTFDTTETFHDVYDTYSSLREPRGISPQGFFGHLVEYGGTYYSYLFDRAVSGKIWRQIFNSGSNGGGLDREAGERFAQEVLRWGGAKDPWRCLGRLLEDDRLSDGGHIAMGEVGKWGVHSWP